jgi:hypothetical protein
VLGTCFHYLGRDALEVVAASFMAARTCTKLEPPDHFLGRYCLRELLQKERPQMLKMFDGLKSYTELIICLKSFTWTNVVLTSLLQKAWCRETAAAISSYKEL